MRISDFVVEEVVKEVEVVVLDVVLLELVLVVLLLDDVKDVVVLYTCNRGFRV